MKIPLLKLKILFLGLFTLGCAASWGYQIFYVWPRDRCLARAAWWDPETRICGTPILLPKITGRPFGSPPVAADAVQAPLVAPGAQSTSPAP